MNITLSVDERVVEGARATARKMGKSLNQAVRDYMAQLSRESDRDALWDDFEARAMASTASFNGWKFDREEANER
jgi:hypothetical protein